MKKEDASIMIVKYNDLIAKMWERAIRKADFPKIFFAYNGPDAIGTYVALLEKPDLIVLGVKMPEIDGFTVCKTIRKLEKQSGRKPAVILIITNQSLHKPNIQAEKAEADDIFQTSNLLPTELATIINDFIEKR